MGKKKKMKKALRKIAFRNRLFMGIFLVLAYITGLVTLNMIAYADLEVCRAGGYVAFHNSQGPVGFVLDYPKK